jgi:2-haloacid dehalogenase
MILAPLLGLQLLRGSKMVYNEMRGSPAVALAAGQRIYQGTEVTGPSSNLWDAAGAKAFGYPVCWCNRSGTAKEDWGFAPDFTVSRLDKIGEMLNGRPPL